MDIFSCFSTLNAGVGTPPPLSLAAPWSATRFRNGVDNHYPPHSESMGNFMTGFPKINIIERTVDYL